MELKMSEWRPIETAPKDYDTRIICLYPDGTVDIAVWKENPRISRCKPEERDGLSAEYFGDTNEMDDYELARPEGAATHWIAIPPPPQR
jgi:hypothetical protein